MSYKPLPMLPLDAATKQHEFRNAWASSTVSSMKFGETAKLRKITAEASAIANVADHAQRATRQAIEAHFRYMADVTLPEGGRMVKSYRSSKMQREAVLKAADNALAGFDSRAAALKSALERHLKPPSDAGTAILDGQLREHLRHLDGAQLLAAIRGNPDFARAAATAPRELTGLAEDTHKIAREAWLQKASPDDYEAHRDLVESLGAMKDALAAMDKELDTYTDFSNVQQLADAAEAAQA